MKRANCNIPKYPINVIIEIQANSLIGKKTPDNGMLQMDRLNYKDGHTGFESLRVKDMFYRKQLAGRSWQMATRSTGMIGVVCLSTLHSGKTYLLH